MSLRKAFPIAVVLALSSTGAVVAGVGLFGVKLLPLPELPPQGGEWQGPGTATIGRRIYDNVWMLQFDDCEEGQAIFRTGPGWDLFETWVGVPDQCRGVYLITFYVDAQRVMTSEVHAGQPPSFLWVRMTRRSQLTVKVRPSRDEGWCPSSNVGWLNPRLVRGRTKPARPMDLRVRDGQLVVIEVPGEYRIHFRR
jgi:hypothetical protein